LAATVPGTPGKVLAARRLGEGPIVASMVSVAPYGSWKSPLTAERVVEDVVVLGYPVIVGDVTYWTEGRPAEGGRVAIVRRQPDGTTEDVFGPDFSARTLVHEYGGLCYAVEGDTVYFSNFADQRLYRAQPGADPEPITAEPAQPASVRYAAPVVSRDGHHLYCVRERHGTGVATEVENDIVVLATDGEAEPRVVADGHDFFSFPTLSPDGGQMAWTSWDHPRMPWDGTELWDAELGRDGLPVNPRLVAGSETESVTQPKYSPDGRLHFISDRSGWWNLYVDDENHGTPVAPAEAEFAGADWVFGQSTYGFSPDGTIVAVSADAGLCHLNLIGSGIVTEIGTPYTELSSLVTRNGGVVGIAGSSRLPTSVVSVDLPSGDVTVLRSGRSVSVEDARYFSEPEPIEFPTEDGLTAHALFYPPENPDFTAPPGEVPPLIVSSHGGPTSRTSSALDYGVQFWTSRGIGVVDVNYGGSTGYGRRYRERLRDNWGIVDLDDCVNAARYLAASGRADPKRLLIHGGSAGGYTTLCAVTFRDVFAAGASYFGVADAGALASDTHKFESRYCDGLIGPWPEAEGVYRARSPLFHSDQLSTPLILFQGLEDKVVPPEQSASMGQALRSKGVPFAYVTYEGEQHGFRRAENIKATLEAELYFYGRVLGFAPADELPPIAIENAQALPAAAAV
jgi:dipeptidyl aminopeptidase/acylaminoacyl peptidase